MEARIYKRPKSAMQSGKALTDEWVLEFAPAQAEWPDPLMGWSGSGDTRPARLLARIVERCAQGGQGPLSQASLAGGTVGRIAQFEDQERLFTRAKLN